MLVIRHLYIERRMIPLNIYLQDASQVGDQEQIARAVVEYGNAIKADSTITTEQAEAAILALQSQDGEAVDPGRVLRPKEVAARLHVSRKTVCDYGKRGILQSVYRDSNTRRRLGYTEASLRAFIHGRR